MEKDNNNLRWYNRLKTTPEEAKKPIKGGRLKGKTDINPMWRIQRATETWGPCGIGWKPVITKQELITHGDEVKAFVSIDLYIKDGDQWSDPIPGLGGSSFVAKESGGSYVSDECFKMAFTDALGSAFKLLGMSADVYWDAGTKYDTLDGNQPDKQQSVQNQQGAPMQQQNGQAKQHYCVACRRPINEQEAQKSFHHFEDPLCEPCMQANWERRKR